MKWHPGERCKAENEHGRQRGGTRYSKEKMSIQRSGVFMKRADTESRGHIRSDVSERNLCIGMRQRVRPYAVQHKWRADN
ncbi:hypothetical protein GCM10027415_02100 [Humibacter ginsengisoli]